MGLGIRYATYCKYVHVILLPDQLFGRGDVDYIVGQYSHGLYSLKDQTLYTNILLNRLLKLRNRSEI